MAPTERSWPAFNAVRRLGYRYPEEVQAWLRTMYTKLGTDPACAFFIAQAELDIGGSQPKLTLEAIRQHTEILNIINLGTDAALKSSTSGELLEKLADILLNGPVWQSVGASLRSAL